MYVYVYMYTHTHIYTHICLHLVHMQIKYLAWVEYMSNNYVNIITLMQHNTNMLV